MGYYGLIPFIAMLILATCNGAIIFSEKKDGKKYSLLIFNSGLFVWSAIDALIWINSVDHEFGLALQRVMSIVWLSIGFLFLNFVFEMLNKKRNLQYYMALIISGLLVTTTLFTNKIIVGVESAFWGIVPVLGEWILIALMLVILPMIYGIVLILKARNAETDIRLKKIYGILVVGCILVIVLESSVDIILPVIFKTKLISMATLGNAILAAFLLWIIGKYRFLELSVEEFSQNIFDKVNEGVIITSADGNTLMINNAAKNFLKKGESEIRKIVDSDNTGNSLIKSKISDLVTGESTYLNISSNRIFDSMNRPLNLYLINDVSELVKFKNSLQDKIEEMQITLYRIGHDIKGPAGAIKQLVLFGKTDKDNIDLYLDKIEISISQLINFIQEVEALIRMKEAVAVASEVNLIELVKRCWDELGFFRQNNKHRLELNIQTEIITTDQNSIYTVLLNIISNAIKYHDLENKEENIITVSSQIKNSSIEIEISDNGMGMEKTTADNVYKLFYRGNSTQKGAGLGMYIVKQAIEKIHGTIAVSTMPHKGTTFVLTIPVKCITK